MAQIGFASVHTEALLFCKSPPDIVLPETEIGNEHFVAAEICTVFNTADAIKASEALAASRPQKCYKLLVEPSRHFL